MAFLRIFYWLGAAILLYAALMALTAFGGLILGEYTQMRQFGLLALIVGVIGMIIASIGQNAPTHETTRDVLVFLALFWLLIPFFACLPYLSLPNQPGLGRAYFEAVSAVTTTGASSLNADDMSKSLLLFRALLQWSGGCMVATLAVVVLAALNLGGTGEHRSGLFILKKGEIFSHLFSIGRLVTLIYSAIAAVCLLFLYLSGTPLFDAICLSLSAISTGGLTPRDGLLVHYVSLPGVIILALTCLLGAANISILYELIRKRNRTALFSFFRNVEHRGVLAVIVLMAIFGFLFTGGAHLFTDLIEAIFMATTTGFDYHVIGIDMVPAPILIAFCLIGGSALSTAGGIKIIRILLLFRHMRTDLDRMVLPMRVMPVKFQGRQIDDKAFLSIWMYFFGYTLVFGLGIMALGAAGLDLPYAISASASALANNGPLLGATYPEFGYANMSGLQLGVLTIVMLLGRVEVLAAFALLTPSLWRG